MNIQPTYIALYIAIGIIVTGIARYIIHIYYHEKNNYDNIPGLIDSLACFLFPITAILSAKKENTDFHPIEKTLAYKLCYSSKDSITDIYVFWLGGIISWPSRFIGILLIIIIILVLLLRKIITLLSKRIKST